MGDKVGENPAAFARRSFSCIREKPQGGCSNTPPHSGRRLIHKNLAQMCVLVDFRQDKINAPEVH